MDTLLGVQLVMPLELAREALEFITLQRAEKGWSVYSIQKKALCVLPNILQRPMPKSPVKSKKCLKKASKPFYGYSSERPQGVPQEFKVFARLDKQARCMKATLPEGPRDKVWWRVTRDFKTGNIIKSYGSQFRRRRHQRPVD